MKLVYSYNNQGYFEGVLECQEDPLNKGQYLIPARSTSLHVPKLKKDEEAKFINGDWLVVTSREKIKTDAEETEKQRLIDEKNSIDIEISKRKIKRQKVKDKIQPILQLSEEEMNLLFG